MKTQLCHLWIQAGYVLSWVELMKMLSWETTLGTCSSLNWLI